MIDDVDYLLQNSVEQSVSMYIDSGLRDKLIYPYPNDYTVTFDQPFKNVFGFEVLDGSMPSTMYNVDVYNNDVYFTIIKKSPNNVNSINSKTFFSEIITSTTFINMYNDGDGTFILIGTVANFNTYTSITNTNPKYKIFIRNISTDIPIVKKKRQISDEYYIFTFNNIEYALQINDENQPTIDILLNNEYHISLNSNGLYDLVYYDIYDINLAIYSQISAAGNFIISISNYHVFLPLGNYDITTITSALNDLFNPFAIDVQPTTSPAKQEGKILFSSANMIILNGAKGSLIGTTLGFDSYPQFTTDGNNFNPIIIGNNNQLFESIIDTSVTTDISYKLVSPGLVNLLGERFCILQIHDLQDHIDGSFAYTKFNPGIGIFKMASSAGGITNLRFDYIALVRKPFHPIGKLSKLRLQFFTKDGNPYDFKGVNHQLLFVIKFRVPVPKVTFTKSILNPNYDGDIMQYLSKNENIENKEDSDDEQEFNTDQHYLTYKKELDKYDYSSSENQDSSSSSESEEEVTYS